jgi:O-antigen ligase
MGIRIPNSGRVLFIFSTMLAMIAGLLISRATLSSSMILFIAATVLHKNWKAQLANFFKTPCFIGMAVLFLLPFVSGLWSENGKEWVGLVRIKLPLLLLPLAFAGNWQLRLEQWRALALFFVLVAAAGTAWSFYNYWIDKEAINESYLRAKVFLTPLENDHVRFSWMVAVAALLCLWFVENASRWIKCIARFFALWFVVYLHVLTARTGLFSLYLMLAFYAVWKISTTKSTRLVAAVVLAVVVLPLLAWRLLPTFQNRIKYFAYDHSFIKSGTYLPGGNDGNRALSFRAGWHVLKTHPFGVGAGDVWEKTDTWYKANVPGMLDTDKLYPSSEWLLYGGSTGCIGMVLFTLVMVIPFFYKPPLHRFYWYAVCATASLSFLFDIGLEVQYGVFLYSFIVLWWWKWFSAAEKGAS